MRNIISEDFRRFIYLAVEINAAYHEASLRVGLSDSASTVLYTLRMYGDECLISDIISLSGISKQTVNSALRKLEQEGIVYLEVFRGRKKRIYLTEKGKKVAEETIDKIINIENVIYDGWSEKDRKMYNDLTQKYLNEFKIKIKDLNMEE